jgi:hypothetical protein
MNKVITQLHVKFSGNRFYSLGSTYIYIYTHMGIYCPVYEVPRKFCAAKEPIYLRVVTWPPTEQTMSKQIQILMCLIFVGCILLRNVHVRISQRIRWINDGFLEDVLNDNYIHLRMARKGRNML